jgi:HNH endonuclease.
MTSEQEREYKRLWYLRNKDRIATAKRLDYVQHRASHLARSAAWRAMHPDAKRQWHVAHKERAHAMNKEWRAAHTTELQRKMKEWFATHKEHRRAYNKANAHRLRTSRQTPEARARKAAWAKANVERVRTYKRGWKSRHKDAGRVYAATRRARQADAFIEVVDHAQVFADARGVCAICRRTIKAPEKWHVDHIFPLGKRGTHGYDNVQLAHDTCNLAKGSKIPKGQPTLWQVRPD